MVKLCVFDLDGTVADTLGSIAYFANEALKKYGFPPYSKDKYRQFVGDGADILIRRMIEGVDGNDEDFKNVKAEYMATYNADCCYLTKPYAGITETLNELKNMGIKNVILSNKPQIQAETVANTIFGGELISEVCGGREGIPLKPDPTVLNELLEKYNVKKEECILLGDSKPDMMLASNAGVKSIGVLWGFRDEKELKENNASYIVSKPNEIIGIIKKL